MEWRKYRGKLTVSLAVCARLFDRRSVSSCAAREAGEAIPCFLDASTSLSALLCASPPRPSVACSASTSCCVEREKKRPKRSGGDEEEDLGFSTKSSFCTGQLSRVQPRRSNERNAIQFNRKYNCHQFRNQSSTPRSRSSFDSKILQRPSISHMPLEKWGRLSPSRLTSQRWDGRNFELRGRSKSPTACPLSRWRGRSVDSTSFCRRCDVERSVRAQKSERLTVLASEPTSPLPQPRIPP